MTVQRIGLLILLAGTVSVSAQQVEHNLKQYREWMQQAREISGRIDKALGQDMASVPADAEKLVDLFDEVEAYWIVRNVEDAQEWALNVGEAADELGEAAGRGDAAAAREALKNAQANCAACHQAHRVKGSDGGFNFK
jgi:mono/diheme cytochrome c family protein